MLFSICSGLEFWSVIWKLWKGFKNTNFFDEVSNNRPNDLLGKNAYKTLGSCW